MKINGILNIIHGKFTVVSNRFEQNNELYFMVASFFVFSTRMLIMPAYTVTPVALNFSVDVAMDIKMHTQLTMAMVLTPLFLHSTGINKNVC